MLVRDTQPFRLGDIAGNAQTVEALARHSLAEDFPPVMLFEGPSGTGKTTSAYIVAALRARDNAVDDQEPLIDPATGKDSLDADGKIQFLRFRSPRPDSPASLDIREGRFARDVSFFNASKMGKDGVLALEERMMTQPLQDGRRTIIIDEAQELSKAGKGAALALLEKKSRKTCLILCTMNLEMFDKAIVQRAQVYHFERPTRDEIARYLMRVIENSPIDYNGYDIPRSFFSEGLSALAVAARGSVRWAVQLLDRALEERLWTAEQIEKLGLPSETRVSGFLEALYRRDAEAIRILRSLEPTAIRDLLDQTRRQILAVRRFQVIGEAEFFDEGICNAHAKQVGETLAISAMLRRIDELPYLSRDGAEWEALEYIAGKGLLGATLQKGPAEVSPLAQSEAARASAEPPVATRERTTRSPT